MSFISLADLSTIHAAEAMDTRTGMQSFTPTHNHRCKKTFFTFFIIFYKKRIFNVFYFWERFLFSSGEFFYRTKPAKNPTKPAKFLHKTTFK